MGNLSKLTTCNSDFEAQLLKGALKAEGIVCMLSNENMTNLYGGMISSFTGVDVLVQDADFAIAKQIIDRQETVENASNERSNEVEWSFG